MMVNIQEKEEEPKVLVCPVPRYPMWSYGHDYFN